MATFGATAEGCFTFYPGLLDEFVFGRAEYKVSAYVCIAKYLEQDVLGRRPEGILTRRIPYGLSVPKDMEQKPNGRLRLAYVGQLVEETKRPWLFFPARAFLGSLAFEVEDVYVPP